MKRKIKILSPVLLLTVLLFGCQKNTPAPLEEVQAPDSDTVSLTVWGAAEDEELLREMIGGFEQQYRGQADFQITYQPQSESSCTNALMADLENGADVFAYRASCPGKRYPPAKNTACHSRGNIRCPP